MGDCRFPSGTSEKVTDKVPLSEIAQVNSTIGLLSVGGGLTSWFAREMVERRNWLTYRQFLSGLAINQILPGPTTVNLTVFFGMRLRGPMGALVAFVCLLVLPSIAAIVLYTAYSYLPDSDLVQYTIVGVAASALGLNLATGIETIKRHRDWRTLTIASIVFVAVAAFHFSIPWVVLVVAPISFVLFRLKGHE
jgi:chromate transporter